ncbi:ABC transporter permease [Acetivibrio cellulolyticus]|uniref:ABC transporter permease n=1 Tax=Acetivibrio cellulolyticus TaxID=35830 RepID=UPI0001E2E7B7|nr:ABC transporter permease [Acetivibrio cellulolyticus]
MESFKAALINEIEKMYKKKKMTVILIISVTVIVIGKLISLGFSNFGIGGTFNVSAASPISVLSVLANTLLPLFTALVASDLFSGEFSHNTMKISLTRPISRFKLFSAKVAAIAFFVLANLLIVMFLSTIVGLICNFSSITFISIIRIIVSYLVTLLPIMVLALIVVFFSNIFKSSSAVFFIFAMFYIVSYVMGTVFQPFSGLFITSMLNWHTLWIADTMLLSKISREFLIMLGYGIMFFTAGYYLFDKRDL